MSLTRMLDLVLLVALSASPKALPVAAIPAVKVKPKKQKIKAPQVKENPKKTLPKISVKSPKVKSTPCDLSKAPSHDQVPQVPGLSKYRAAVLRRAAEEIGQVHPNQPGISVPLLGTTKKGADRLLEYSIVAYGSAPDGWLGHASPNPKEPGLLAPMFRQGAKHTTWCGIFALWAAKSGAAVMADDYAPTLAGALANPVIALLAATFMDFYAPSWADDSRWAAMKNVEWRNGVGFTVPKNGKRVQKSPRAVSSWFSKGEAPPITPGDIGYTVIPTGTPTPTWDGNSHHHYLVEKIHRTPEGHIIYYTIEGNFHNQQVKRWKRCYNGSEGIHYFYDVDTLADPP